MAQDDSAPPLRVWLWTGILAALAVAALAVAVLVFDVPLEGLT
jgi:hypothetical protein